MIATATHLISVIPTDLPIIGDRVTGSTQGQEWTGTVVGRSYNHNDGSGRCTVAIDKPVYGPSGRAYHQVNADLRQVALVSA